MANQTGSPVSFDRETDIALITVDNPPVNALSRAVRAGLLEALRLALADAAIRAVVIRCKGRTFIAGADVTEFGKPPETPYLPEVTQAIENSTKPVVVALHGTALGGGFEIALAAHYRIAARTTKVGLPEVKLGLMPGAGGTQRLPRLIGVAEALQWITTGNGVSAERALELGAIDEIADADLDRAALAAARRLIAAAGPQRRTGQLPAPAPDDTVFAEIENAITKKQRGLVAPHRCVDAIRAATTHSFAEGLQRERELFLELRASPQAAALRHAFLGEREGPRCPVWRPTSLHEK